MKKRARFVTNLLIPVLVLLLAPLSPAAALSPAPALLDDPLALADLQQQVPEKVGEVLRIQLESPAYGGAAERGQAQLVWEQKLTMPGASYIAPHFAHFDLPRGAELVVRSPDYARSWSYTGFGKGARLLADGFWGVHIHGDTAVVELYSQVPVARGAVLLDSFAHGYPTFGQPGPESVCGTDDSQEAKCYQTSEPALYNESRAVARLLINGTSLCTGWLIGDQGHLMTNNHCIGSSSSALNTNYEFDAEGASCATNCRTGSLACPGTVEATSATFIQTDFNLDYTLVQLPTNITGTYGFMQLRSSGATLGERIYLPGHPAGWGKQLAVASTHTANPTGFCEVDSLSEPVCAGGSVAEVGYYCDTRGGSSGSPVLATSDNCVVALHHCRGAFACTGTGGDENRGVPVGAIISDLGGNLPSNALCGSGGGGALDSGTDTHDENIRTVSLTGLSNPIVKVGPPSFNGAQPGTVRVRNVTSSSFQHNFQEWNYLDGTHVNEDIGWLAVDSGAGTLGSLDKDAGSVSVDENWVSVSFSQSFSGAPVVLAQVASFSGSDAVTTRLRNVTASGFDVRIQEEEALGPHAFETVHWIAIEVGSTTVGGQTLIVGRTGNSVTQAWFTINFGASLSGPVFVASIQTFDGPDTATLRHQALTSSSVEVKVEEEESADAEVNHTTEVVGWVAIGN